MTVDTVTVPAASGSPLTGTFTVNPIAQTYPYAVKSFASVAKAGDSVQAGTARIGSTPTILDFANIPQELGDLVVAQWATGGYSVFVPAAAGYLHVNWDLAAAALSPNTVALLKAITSGTNNFNVLRLGGSPSPSNQPAFLSGRITGNGPAGVIFNGVQLYEAVGGGTIGPLYMGEFPGLGSVPPDETFMLGAWRVGGVWNFTQVELDGRVNGVASSASNFGHNYIASGAVLNYTGLYSHHVKYGAGITHYMNQGVTFNHNGSRFDQCQGASFNIEQCGGSTYNLSQPVFGVATEDLIADATNGFMSIHIADPVFTDGRTDGKLHITCHKNYSYGLPSAQPNQQLDPTTGQPRGITCTVAGVARPDLITYAIK